MNSGFAVNSKPTDGTALEGRGLSDGIGLPFIAKKCTCHSVAVVLAGTFIPVFLIFGALEVAVRIWEAWNPPMTVDLGQGFHESSRLFVPSQKDPTLMITNPDKLVSFREESFDRVKSRRTFRAFVVGDSSVNYAKSFFADVGEVLAKELKHRFDKVEIVNCGGTAHGSERLVLVVREVVQYDPDVILFHEANNEFEEVQQRELAHLPSADTQRFLSRSALYRLIRDVVARRQISQLEKEKRRRDLSITIPDCSKIFLHRFTPEENAGRMQAFRDNLAAIIRTCQERKIPIIIGTVPSNLVRPSLPGPEGERYQKEVLPLYDAGEWEKGAALGREILKNTAPREQASDVENGIIRNLCRGMKVQLADVEAKIIAMEPHHVPGETLFVDECHLNMIGDYYFADVFGEEILKCFGRRS